jgi:hypothetical protein
MKNKLEGNVKMNSLVSVVFPTMNRKEDLIKCIQSIKKSTYSPIEIIIADNGSTDGSKQIIKELFPEVIILESEINLGSPIAINKCIKKSKGEFILRLDDDIILESDTIEKMIRVIRSNEKIGAVGALCFYTENPDLLRNAGMKINMFFGKTKVYGKNSKNIELFKGEKERNFIGGGTMIIRRSVYDKIGLFDENYFFMYEDVDWLFRLKKAGYIILVTSSARLYHKKEIINSKKEKPIKVYLDNRSQVLFMKKNAGFRNVIFLPYLILILYPLKVFLFSVKRHFKSIAALTKGIFDALFNEKVFVYDKEGKKIDYHD